MSAVLAAFLDDYSAALRRHVAAPGQAGLTEGYDLGRRALVEDISLLDLTEHHYRTVADFAGPPADPRGAEVALEFLLQTMAALDIATRGYLDGTRRYEQQRSRAEDLAGRDAFRTALVESLQDGFFVADSHGTIVEVNSAFGVLTGYDADQVPYPLPHPWTLSERAGYPQIGTDASRFVMPIRHRDGRERWLAVSASSLVKQENNEQIFVGTVRDVTAEHDAQARDQAASRLATAVGAATSMVEVLAVGLDELRRTMGARTALVAVWPSRTGQPDVYSCGEPPADDAETTEGAPRFTAAPVPDPSGRITLDDETRGLLDRARRQPARGLSAITGEDSGVDAVVAPLGETGDAALWVRFGAPRVISAADWALYSLLVGHLSVALQRARNFDQARATSLTLQRAMLGPIELPPRFSVHYEPALPPLEIGGDWYDVVPLRDGTIGVVVGDCVGRGLSAAVVMGQLRTAARALLLRGAGPAQLLSELDAVAARIPGAMCTTVCAAVLDPERGMVRYSNAGHMPPILAPPGGPGRILEGGRAVPLATFETPRRPEATTALPPGATLVLFTDGLVEQRGYDIDEGFVKIAGVLSETGGALPRDVADAVLSRLCPPAGYDDDVAMVVYRQPPEPLHLDIPAAAAELTGLRRDLYRWFATAAVPHDLAADLVAAANEACSNSVEHAYRDAEPGRVTLTATCEGDRVVIEVADTGRWIPTPTDPGFRGRGVEMMRVLTEDLEFGHDENGTRVRMWVTLPSITFPTANPLRGSTRPSALHARA
ncbi:SpoIIE family protein phosphatase [Nocardia asteroides]|uniref:SpoIIE family protein phosphatase n=1 Tax=Nocardia asteroides TaxID=1824 RepID=UPI001E5A057D|nr:SpoIIE family protein phosphatase [Nocardia asteroides]UGT56214.1 SpoIIE family protein phosphatase [Nocardia asteroides]